MNHTGRTISYKVLSIFAPLLILTGIAGYLLPPRLAVMSGVAAYDIFHIVFGVLGIAALISNKDQLVNAFNIGFGSIDIYQAIAARLHLFPEGYFHWTRVDDIVHVGFGVMLVLAGLLGGSKGRAETEV